MKATIARAIIALSVVVLLLACPALGTDPEPSPDQASGGLSLRLSGIAPWLLAAMEEDEPEAALAQPLPRAYLFTGRVRILLEMDDGSGGWTNVISPVEQDVSWDNSSSGSATSNLSVPGIRAGTGYRLSLSLYNLAVSTTVPVAGAQATVDIQPGEDTTASLVCVPLGATAIVPGEGPWTPALTAGQEVWYQVSALAGDLLTITQSAAGTPSFLFDGTGHYLASLVTGEGYDLTLTEDSSYFIGVAAPAAASSNLDVLLNFVPKNEGSLASPLALTLDNPHAFTVGPAGRTDDTSWYSFTVSALGEHWLDYPGNAGLQALLYSDAAFSVEVPVEAEGFGAALGELAAGTYYLTITSLAEAAEFSGIVATETYALAHSDNEGTADIPISLSDGVAHSAGLGHAAWDWQSYYRFTTGDFGAERVELSSMSPADGEVYLDLFTSADFSSGYLQSFQASAGSFDLLLTPNTTYYLLAGNPETAMVDSGLSFTVTSTAQAVPEPVPLALSVPVSGTLGTEAQYWKLSGLTAGRRYRVWWDGAGGSGDYTGECSLSAYYPDFSDSYFVNDLESGYSGGRMVTLATGQTELVIKVAQANASTGTFRLQVTGENEGSLTCPVVLDINTAHTFPVGPAGRDDDTSWYTFDLAAPGQVWFDYYQPLDGIVTTLYSDAAYSSTVASTMAVNGLAFSELSAGTWYLKVQHAFYHEDDILSYNGRVVDETWVTTNAQNEGSVSMPVFLADAVLEEGTAGCTIYDRISYYSFTTGYTGRMLVDFQDASLGYGALGVYLYTGQDYVSGKWGKIGLDVNGDYSIILQPETAYYLKVMNTSAISPCTYSLTMTALATQAPITVPINMGSPYNGMLTESPQYFQFSGLTAGAGYRVNVYSDNQIRVSAYKENWSGVYYSNWGSGDAFVFIQEGQSSLVLEIGQVDGLGSFSITVFSYSPSTMYLRGTMNGWGDTLQIPMEKNIVGGDTIWTCTSTLIAMAHQFKFERTGVPGSWAENWGTGEGNEAVYAGDNINYNATVAGDYTFTFNMSDMIWSVTPP